MKSKYLLVSLILFFNLNLFSNTNKEIFTAEELKYIKYNPIIKIAMLNNFKPFSFIEDNKHQGLSVDILEQISTISNLKFDIHSSSWSKALTSFKEKKVDMLSGISYTKKREEFSLFTEPFYEIPTYIFGLKNNTDYKSIEDLEGKKIGIGKDIFYKDSLLKKKINVIEYHSSIEKAKALALGEIDYFLASFTSGKKAINSQSLTNIKALDEFIGIKKEDLRYGINKENRILHSIIEKSLNKIKNSKLEFLINKWILNLKKSSPKLMKFSENELKYLKNNPTLKVHNELNWAPYNYNIDGKPYGFSIDYMNLLASKTGLNVEYINGFTWNQFLEKIKKNEIDVMLNIAKTSEREKYLNFTTPYINAVDTVFTRIDSKYKKLEDFNGKTIATVKGFYEEEIIRQYYPKIKLFLVNNSLEGLKAVVFGKADGAINDFGSANFLIEKYNLSTIKPAFEANNIFKLDLNLGTNKNNVILRDILEKAKQSIAQDEILKLKRKWFKIDKKKLILTIQQQQYLQNKKEITFCTDPNWLPFEKIKDGKLSGISADYIKIFEDNLGIPFKLISTSSWSESLEFAKQRKCDILSVLAMETPKRKKYFNFTTPYINMPLILATKLNVTFVTDLKTLTTEKVGISKEYAYIEILRNKYPHLNIIEVDDVKDGLNKVKNGELFGYIGTLATVGYMFQTHYTGELKVAGKFDEISKLGIGIRNDDKILFNILQKVVMDIDKNTHKNILNKHIAIKYEKKINYKPMWQLVFVVFVILVGIIYWNRKLSKLNKQLNKTKKELEESVYDFEYLFNNTIEAIALFQNNICIDINEAGMKLFGCNDKSKLIGKNVLEFVAPDSIEIAKQKLVESYTESYELNGLDYNGNSFPVLVKGYNKIIKGIPSRIVSVIDLTKLKQKENELIKAKDQALEATKIKSNFLSNMSHEIRTPMNAVIGIIHLIQQTNLDKKQKNYISKIQSASNNLLNIINDILDFSKIEAGKLTLNKVNFNLKNILYDIENIVSINAIEKNLDFSIKHKDNININLNGDSLRVTQILLNLISNAIKFTHEGKVELQIEQIVNDKFRFSVSDTGIGISEKQSKKLFSSFTQADTSITRQFGGTGLGLAICKELIELMHGKIWIESKIGVGSKFIFEIILEQSDKIIEDKKDILTNYISKTDTISVNKKDVSNKIIDQLFDDLKIAVKKRRPNLCTPIIDELENYKLNELDQELFDKIHFLIKKYKFDEANEILNDR